MEKLRTGIIIGSTREGRFAEKAASWIYELAKKRVDLDVELVDLRDYPMPFFEDAVPPAYGSSENSQVRSWQSRIASLDGFIFTAAEYNRGPTAVLKNALDYAYHEWSNKPAAFVGYGGVGGARAVEQLRLHAVELQMAPIRTAVHILLPDFLACRSGEKSLSQIEHLNQGAESMLDQFAWWAKALKMAREATAQREEAV
ncbi:NADPH-dependent FMN reductase [Chelativorans intermedius]|uniref:NADPH-dependent FMN reductase n=1 Tax=Chelativorans intermedius TaxID=515947 RepID=A0ABV6D359_9HYPH|nr:NAD(P)H-dependent oxidoreductase [Chelativorans intermedius]MCT8998424.1 NAD(P)H-dependent oxidoreductase [Chelativorans intermedius]